MTCENMLALLACELIGVGTYCLRSAEISCLKETGPRLKNDKVAKACLYENGNVPFMPLMELSLVQCSKSENKAFVF